MASHPYYPPLSRQQQGGSSGGGGGSNLYASHGAVNAHHNQTPSRASPAPPPPPSSQSAAVNNGPLILNLPTPTLTALLTRATTPSARAAAARTFYANAHVGTRHLVGHRKSVRTVAWNANGTKLASGSLDGAVRVCLCDTRITNQTAPSGGGSGGDMELKGHTDSVDSLVWSSANNDVLATCGGDRFVKLWDTRTGKAAATIATSGENINIAWSADTNAIAVGNKKNAVTIIDTRKAAALKTVDFNFEINEIAFTTAQRDSDVLLISTHNGTLDLCKLNALNVVCSIDCHNGPLYCIDVAQDSRIIATGGADATVNLIETNDLTSVGVIQQSESPIRALSFSHDCELIAIAGEQQTIDIVHINSKTTAATITVDVEVNSLAFSPKHHLLAYTTDSKSHQPTVYIHGVQP